ncbi:trypsin-like peptidase domain-containing protein [Pontibacter liquoris]|uniref:trypsin-like peptidase domain-containing protein n=1 Tax=Pontibacter liquoris TaxID=2905677 RepID=UPI001FA7B7E6|nr:trypsin-like peptidase domain-containing protein [Pontibacter liquoris]
MKKAGFVLIILLISLLSAALAIAGYRYFGKTDLQNTPQDRQAMLVSNQAPGLTSSAQNPDFVQASSAVIPAVVHIKTQYEGVVPEEGNPLFDLFGMPQQAVPAQGSGSGVLISADGYIVTNNHVIENASSVEVVLPDKRSFKAKLIGTDPTTDLALVKVQGDHLPVVALGNSDNVQVGEWVLAVGYPFSLNSTVTAGIISAKGRSIGILNRPSQENYSGAPQASLNTAIESFIQTDAAINPGNSGGALVNTNGQLIGINAAIASQTGSYAGYGFAIPVNLMRKVVGDIRKFGEVRRGYLGVSFPAPAVEDQILKERGIDPSTVKGVYVLGIQAGSGAAAAGLKEGDIIQSIDEVNVSSSSELSERIARHHPGDKVALTYLRNGRTGQADVVLKGEESEKVATTDKTSGATGLQSKLGATFAPVPDPVKQRYRLKSGVYVTELQSGGFFDLAGIPKGTIITNVNGKPVNSLSDINKALGVSRGRTVRLDGITPDGASFVLNFPLGA